MNNTLIKLLDLLESRSMNKTGVIQWGSPIPSFGDISTSVVATIGLNPSNREFVDETGHELRGKSRRFSTLKSLGLHSWNDIDSRHLPIIMESCNKYFFNNPYNRWFKILDTTISGINVSYYKKGETACHLDLIPFATNNKWNDLSPFQRSTLIELTNDFLALIVRESPIKLLILNGKSVVEIFQDTTNVHLDKHNMESWSLQRHSSKNVMGIAYYGVTNILSGIPLDRNILILGFNHNLQSSFGVSQNVLFEIQKWICHVNKEFNL
jgi:hypothetical protein